MTAPTWRDDVTLASARLVRDATQFLLPVDNWRRRALRDTSQVQTVESMTNWPRWLESATGEDAAVSVRDLEVRVLTELSDLGVRAVVCSRGLIAAPGHFARCTVTHESGTTATVAAKMEELQGVLRISVHPAAFTPIGD